MDDQLGAQLTTSAVIVWVIERLKAAKWFPWLSVETWRLNRAIAVILSGLAALGIHAEFNSVEGILTITGLTLTSILHGGADWISSFVIQQVLFRGYRGATK